MEVERTDISYTIPSDFDINEHFRSFYGVSSLSNAQPEIVQLRIDASQVKFFRTLPLHHSQEEIETTDAYSVFQYYIVPTFELTKEILSNGPYVEVLRPLFLREEIKFKAEKMIEMYK
jgi:predicted DNA-binding transcriptional regulator YafY